MTAEAAEFVGSFEFGEAAHVGAGSGNISHQAGARPAGAGANAGVGSDVFSVLPNGVVECGVARAFRESGGDDGGVASEVVVDDFGGAGDGDPFPVCGGRVGNANLGLLAVGGEDAHKFNLPLAVDFFEGVAKRVAGGAFGVADVEWFVFAGVERDIADFEVDEAASGNAEEARALSLGNVIESQGAGVERGGYLGAFDFEGESEFVAWFEDGSFRFSGSRGLFLSVGGLFKFSEMTVVLISNDGGFSRFVVSLEKAAPSDGDPELAVAGLIHFPIGIVAFGNRGSIGVVGAFNRDGVVAGEFPIASPENSVGERGIVIGLHLLFVMGLGVVGEAGASGAVADIFESAAKGSVFDLPVAGVERFPLGAVDKGIGAGEAIDSDESRSSAESWSERESGGGGFEKVTAVHVSLLL